MRILMRYVVSELLKTMILALTVLTMILLLVMLAQRAMREGLGPLPVLRLVPFILPDALRLSIPAAMLFATCSVYGKMASSNELIALKSMGVSIKKAIIPAVYLAVMVSLVAVWLNDVAVSWGRRGIDRVILRSIEDIAYGMLRSQRSYSSNRFSIHVKDVQDKKLIRPTISFHADGDSPPITLVARQAELKFNPVSNKLRIVIDDTQFDIGASTFGEWPDQFIYELPLRSVARNDSGKLGPSDVALRNLPSYISEQESTIDVSQQTLAAQAGLQMLTGDFNELLDLQWKQSHRKLHHDLHLLNRYTLESWRRWANGFTCLAFVFAGASISILKKTPDMWTTIGFSFLPILIFYYPVFQYGVDRAKAGAFPPYAVWLGNVCIFTAGVFFLRRILRR